MAAALAGAGSAPCLVLFATGAHHASLLAAVRVTLVSALIMLGVYARAGV